MPAYIARPATVFPAHKVTTAEISDDIRAHHPDHPRLPAILRIVGNTGVNTRYFTRPLDAPTVSGDAGVGERAEAAFTDALDLAEQAALRTLTTHGVAATDVDAIITTHSTGWGVPGLDIHLVDRLGLRPHVRRIALTTMACAGGTQALIRAVDMVAARPGSTVLVVAAEVISAVYNHADDAVEHMIYKALFGDSAAATLVTDQPLGPGLRINTPADTYEHVLPNSLTRYNGRVDHTGFHFDSTKEALSAADDVLPHLLDWLGPQIVDFAVIHPGSARIITDTATALGLDTHDTRHSTDTLADEGNLGGVSVLRILERTHTAPPPAGATGVAVAYGPGFNTAAIRGTWQD
ncbi:PhlD [Streptomyces sp. NBC_01221]|uniref:PhlD n=1 Tax=Streptomyces sp. NBC_01221 TaxID=2903782 RepID=UPI00225551AD|nr:PhlD [Streptomyces sp. NBC_01221]MCX4792533.1 PhlD [Streptomyces sp. NBC_01221]